MNGKDSPYETVTTSDAPRGEWLEARRSIVGASDIPAILGLSPWASPISVYADKLGVQDEQEEPEHIRWGHLLEPTILEEYERVTGRLVQHDGRLLRSTRNPILGCTLDGFVLHPEAMPVDAKNIGYAPRAGEWEDEGVPLYVWAQLQAQMYVADMNKGSVAALVMGSRLRWADVERDEKWITETMIPTAEEFWDYVQRQEAPFDMEDNTPEATAKALKRMHPLDSGETISLGAEFIEVDDDLVVINDTLKRLKKEKEALQNKIRGALGDASEGVLPNGTIYTSRKIERRGYEVAPTEYRPLNRKGTKDE